MSNLQKNLHLFHRAGFGVGVKEFEISSNTTNQQLIKEIFINSENPEKLDVKLSSLDFKGKMKDLSQKERKEIQKKARNDIIAINVAWLERMSETKEILNEKMTLFWHNHFACKSRIPIFNLNQNNLIRENALGNFRSLVHSISKDASMLSFLNNNRNIKNAPNENFARELMELFTIGKGNYTEEDIKNAAKSFTGWSFTEEGEFFLRKRQHDSGTKQFFGKTGNFKGEDIINILLDDKRTSHFITTKILKTFVNPIVKEEYISDYSKIFFESDYDIKNLMQKLFTDDDFYSEKNILAQIKSPIELLSGLMKSFNIKFNNNRSPLAIQKILGQILLSPPNVAGWKGGKNWIDSSSLLFRMNLAEYLFKASEIDINYKDELEDNAQIKKLLKQLNAEADLKNLVNYFENKDKNNLNKNLCYYILGILPEQRNIELAHKYSDNTSAAKFIESFSLKLTAFPEFQLC